MIVQGLWEMVLIRGSYKNRGLCNNRKMLFHFIFHCDLWQIVFTLWTAPPAQWGFAWRKQKDAKRRERMGQKRRRSWLWLRRSFSSGLLWLLMVAHRPGSHRGLLLTVTPDQMWDTSCVHLLSIFNIHVLSPPQGADKGCKGPDGISAFECAETDAIKALFKWEAVEREAGGRTDRWTQWSPDRRRTHYPHQPLSPHCFCLFVPGSFSLSCDFPPPPPPFLKKKMSLSPPPPPPPSFFFWDRILLFLWPLVCSHLTQQQQCLPWGPITRGSTP